MKKLIVSLLILATVMLCFTLSISANASETFTSDEGRLPFEDVKDSHWFSDALKFCYANGIIKGMNEYTFGFSGQLTRAQFVTMLASLENVDTTTYTVTKFTDVKSSHWYYGAVAWAYETGIVNGMTETAFVPNGVLTRAQLATVMKNYMEGKYGVEVKDDALDRFTDKPKDSYWYYDAVKYAVSAELLSGNSDGTLNATGNVTRAQAVVIFKSFMEKYFYGSCEHSFTETDCTNSAVCDKCGLINGLPKGHSIATYSCTAADVCLGCGAEVKPSNIAHSFKAATCTEPRTCTDCGATRGEAKGHSWKAATCTTPKTCGVCKATEGSAKGHSWKDATCTAPKTCSVCKATEGAAKGHSWWAATCVNPKMCKVCYATEGKALGHSWKAADCTTPKTCTRCKTTEGSALSANKQHSWWSATCTNPKMCRVCYKTEGSALGHSWKAATCTAAKTCTRCKLTEGSAKGHSWKAATCTAPKTCSVCKATEGKALGHTTTSGTCSRCGTVFVTSGYDAIVNILKTKGEYSYDYNAYMLLVSDSDSLTVLAYYAGDNLVTIENLRTYSNGHSDLTAVYMDKGGSVYDYVYAYANTEEWIFEGYGLLDASTFTKNTTEGFSEYYGTLKSTYTSYMNSALKQMLNETNTILKPYSLSIKDLGFKAF